MSTSEIKKTGATRSPMTAETELWASSECNDHWTSESSSSDVDETEALVQKLLADTSERAQRVLDQGGDRIEESLAKALRQYVDTALAMQHGAAKKDHVLAMIEYVEPLLASVGRCMIEEDASSSKTQRPGTKPNRQFSTIINPGTLDSSGSSSNASTPELKQHSPCLTDFTQDVGSSSNPSTPEIKQDSPRLVDLMRNRDAAEHGPESPGKQFRAAPPSDPDILDLLEVSGTGGLSGTGSEVFLHIYDVGVLSPSVHKVLATLGTGAYHVGVEVYGQEFWYGNTQSRVPDDMTGVSIQHRPRVHSFHKYCGTVSLGHTEMSPTQVKELIKELRTLWPARNYDTLRNNCVSFAEALCGRLGVDAPPEHVGALANGLKGFLWN
jgi:hypothetical protein